MARPFIFAVIFWTIFLTVWIVGWGPRSLPGLPEHKVVRIA